MSSKDTTSGAAVRIAAEQAAQVARAQAVLAARAGRGARPRRSREGGAEGRGGGGLGEPTDREGPARGGPCRRRGRGEGRARCRRGSGPHRRGAAAEDHRGGQRGGRRGCHRAACRCRQGEHLPRERGKRPRGASAPAAARVAPRSHGPRAQHDRRGGRRRRRGLAAQPLDRAAVGRADDDGRARVHRWTGAHAVDVERPRLVGVDGRERHRAAADRRRIRAGARRDAR